MSRVKVGEHTSRGKKIRKDGRLEVNLFNVFSKLRKTSICPFLSKRQKTQDHVAEVKRGPLKAFGVVYETLSKYSEYTVASVGLIVRTWIVDTSFGVLSRDDI